MATLKQLLLDSRRAQALDACVTLVDAEVASKSGLTGLAVKAAYAVVKKVKPGIIREAIDMLIEPFVEKLEPFFADAQKQGGSLETYFGVRAETIANALLGVTDEKAARAKNLTIKAAYDKLRPVGLKHTAAAVPGVARLISKFV